jgi:hypothetical protein
MPRGKKVNAAERRKWLESFETGKPISAIAKTSRRDFRTVKAQVQTAADEREQSSARTAVFRDAIVRHSEGMLNSIQKARDELVVPHDERLTLLYHFPKLNNVAQLTDLDRRKPRLWLVHWGDDERRLLELAEEHLLRDRRTWKNLHQWGDSIDEYVLRCYEFGRDVGKAVTYNAVAGPSGEDSKEGFRDGYIAWLCRMAIEIASNQTLTYKPGELTTIGNELRFPGTTIARSPSEETLARLESEFHEILNGGGVQAMANEISRLKESLEGQASDLRRDLTDILLIGAVTGRCSVCKRLGM